MLAVSGVAAGWRASPSPPAAPPMVTATCYAHTPAAAAARKLKLAVRGVIENMSYFIGDDGKKYEIFGSGGGKQLADELGIALLGQIPLETKLRSGGDTGLPVMISDPDSDVAKAFTALAQTVAKQGPARVYRQELKLV